jgi:MATE family multidrug resistance protein
MVVAARASWHLALLWNAIAAVALIGLRYVLPTFFTENSEVIEMTSTLLVMIALFQLVDGLQNVSIGILRGMQDVRIIMPIAFLSYIILNLPVGYLLGFTFRMGAPGLLFGFTIGLGVAAILLIWRVRRNFSIITKKLPNE